MITLCVVVANLLRSIPQIPDPLLERGEYTDVLPKKIITPYFVRVQYAGTYIWGGASCRLCPPCAFFVPCCSRRLYGMVAKQNSISTGIVSGQQRHAGEQTRQAHAGGSRGGTQYTPKGGDNHRTQASWTVVSAVRYSNRWLFGKGKALAY